MINYVLKLLSFRLFNLIISILLLLILFRDKCKKTFLSSFNKLDRSSPASITALTNIAVKVRIRCTE